MKIHSRSHGQQVYTGVYSAFTIRSADIFSVITFQSRGTFGPQTFQSRGILRGVQRIHKLKGTANAHIFHAFGPISLGKIQILLGYKNIEHAGENIVLFVLGVLAGWL